MTSLRPLIACIFALFTATACGSDGGSGNNGNGGGPDAGANSTDSGGSNSGGWAPLISGEWTIAPGSEIYVCVRLTVAQDTFVSDFRAISPLGTHHTVLAIDSVGGADGTFDCNANTLGDAGIFGSGVGTDPVTFPTGVAVKIPAGSQLLLNLHLFNVSDAAITGRSGTEIKTIDSSLVQHEAEIVLMGSVRNLTVPPGESTQIGHCKMNGDVTLFAVSPHMHQLGTHMKVIAKSSIDGETVVHDGPYDFEKQLAYRLDQPIKMARGDEVEVQCSYNNTTGSTVTFGDSSTEEMCFGSMYRYPALGGTFGVVCDSDFGI